MKKNSIGHIYIGIFIILVFGLGIGSFLNLADFYINDRKNNNEWTPELGSKLETDIASTFYMNFDFVNLNGAIRTIMNQYSMNNIVKMNNGYLLTTVEKCSEDSLNNYANKTIRLNEYLKERGSYLVYAATPYTSSKYDPELPVGVMDYGNDNIDRLLELLKKGGVDVLDYRETMHLDGINQYDYMYVTDHHWTTEAGLYAYGYLEDYIKDKTGCIIDDRIRDINNYSVTKYKKWHLGSRGQRTGIFYAGIDDFDLIVPNFDTKIQNDYGEIGTVSELMFDMTALEQKNLSSRYTYDSVQGKTLGHYVNLNSMNDVKVLLVSDSFGKALGQYLAMGVKEVKYIYDGEDYELTPEYIEEYDPDVVIMLYYSENVKDNSKMFSFDSF
ncbi:alginate O-acetyltransferase AlgX-related protein [Butyrivibrio sp. YAB3001]|uniref:alginate O-acetyltransferase AlgX-related protein n=1 Tax=Butyrivibrio sp. YAB3001 TaxID=1520812 RepID=UPI0008F61C65|nr:hypothetical protein [Butyrivibrio sp. YAB3001]SFC74387.1 SGNH hydrolase-like domain-containing protein, acetyltransferase AlgX [Butyrivibrio sp. YAB3001]